MNKNLILGQLKNLLGEKRVFSDSQTLKSRSHDYWLLDMQRRLHGREEILPICVVKARSLEDLSKLLPFCNDNLLSLVPYGAGSGVCAGARPQKGAIVLDLSEMNKVVSLNETNLTVTVQPGLLGSNLEAYLNERGYSMGHFPQSIALSSVGGWVATRASGQYSSKYGSIENMLVCLKAVLADGSVVESKNAPRSACGPNVNELFLGSEGSLAVIAELTYKIHPLPEKECRRAFRFAGMKAGLEAVRMVMRAGFKPALCRLYDPVDALRHFPDIELANGSLLLLLSEGPAVLAEAELAGTSAIALAAGGKDLGEAPVRYWQKRRFHIPDLRVLAEEKGVVFDTIEVSANWDKVSSVYESVIAALKTLPGLYTAYAHSSHSYQQGTCLYFSFAVKKPNWLFKQILQKLSGKQLGRFDAPESLSAVEGSYLACWHKVMDATIANGGSISHHHGVGKLRMPWLEKELGSSYSLLQRLKDALDPQGILNPGTLIAEKGESK